MLIIAKTQEGREFCYTMKTAHAVSEKSALKICDILNESKYQLSASEKWYIYEIDCYDSTLEYARHQIFRIRKGIVKDCKYLKYFDQKKAYSLP